MASITKTNSVETTGTTEGYREVAVDKTTKTSTPGKRTTETTAPPERKTVNAQHRGINVSFTLRNIQSCC